VPERSSARSVAEAVQGADVVRAQPADERSGRGVLEKLFPSLRAPQLVVDFSTIPVEACRAMPRGSSKATGCRWVDAPVSGGPPAVEAGTLTVMAGGDARTSSASRR
jgi:3-hydroxyisobutyrate dehydrogenase-like beta-hydroxyacid dehydrogenase